VQTPARERLLSFFPARDSFEVRHFIITCQASVHRFVMSSGVEISLILNSFFLSSQRFDALTPVRLASGLPVYVAASQPLHSRLRCASLGMTTTKISAVALASLPRARLGFPGENARAFGKYRHTLRLGAFADKRDKAHRGRA
jgi:hypothetical protein